MLAWVVFGPEQNFLFISDSTYCVEMYPFCRRLLRPAYVDFLKTGCWNSNFQTSEIYKYLQTKSNFHISICQSQFERNISMWETLYINVTDSNEYCDLKLVEVDKLPFWTRFSIGILRPKGSKIFDSNDYCNLTLWVVHKLRLQEEVGTLGR